MELLEIFRRARSGPCGYELENLELVPKQVICLSAGLSGESEVNATVDNNICIFCTSSKLLLVAVQYRTVRAAIPQMIIDLLNVSQVQVKLHYGNALKSRPSPQLRRGCIMDFAS